VAFQVVFVVGDNDVAAPQNLAAAVNYDCANCLTYALAQQLFITLDGPLSEEAMAQLDAIWEALAAFGEEITAIPLSEIQDRLDEFEDAILEVIEADQPGTVPSDEGSETPTEEESDTSPGVTPSPDPTSSAEPSDDSAEEPAESESPTDEPTSSSPTAEPSPTAESSPTG
jgi:putative peptide zinc metalloprotease protein